MGAASGGGDKRGNDGQSGCASQDCKGLVGVTGDEDNGDKGTTVFCKVSFAIVSIGTESKMN